ncbi:MAG: histidine kinase dimerization/phosphoacceptor domain -containing protein [Chitinophagaceae bacterium]
MCVALWQLLHHVAFAQTIQIEHKYYTVEDGLPGRTINHITQDSIGYIWLATNKGICKFNGYTFENYNKQHGLRKEDVKALYFISNEIVWIKYNLLDYDCFDVFNTKTLTTTPFALYYKNQLSPLLIKNLNSVAKVNNNIYYFGVNDTMGVVQFSNNKFTFKKLPHKVLLLQTNEVDNLYALEVSKKRLLKCSSNLQIVDSSYNKEYINKLLKYFFFPYSKDYFTYSESINTVNIKKDEELNSAFKNIETDFFSSFLNDKKYFINDYAIYDNKTSQEVFNYRNIDKSIQSKSNIIHCKFIAPNGTIWLGLEFGLLKVDLVPKRFNALLSNIKQQERNIAVRGIVENSKKKLVIHTENLVKYIVEFDVNNKSVIKEYPSNEFNYALTSDSFGNTYFIDNKLNNINKIDNNGNTKPLFKVGFKDWVWSLSFINKNIIWAGTESQGLYNIDLIKKQTTPINYNGFKEIIGATIYQIKKINDTCIWICTSKGLYKANTSLGIFQRYHNQGKGKFYLPSNNISFLEYSKQNILWLATLDNGLIKYNLEKGLEKEFTKNQGFPTQTIYAAYEDAYNSIWMSSDVGLIQFNKEAEEVSRIYTTKDGITNNEFNRIAHYKSSDSSLFFGGLNGITFFNPKNFMLQKNVSKINLIVEEAKIYNGTTGKFFHVEASVKNNNEIKLNANDRFITLQLALLTYSNVDKIQYAYKLDNDSNWTFQNNRIIQIAGLSWGKHTLTIKAKDDNGVWGNNTVVLHINQLRPFYLQTWFLGSLLAIIGLTFYVIYRYRIKKVEAQKIELLQMVNERTEELNQSKNELQILLLQKEVLLKEIHHRVKNNLTVISSLLELQSDNTHDENAKATLLQGTNRVRSIALIHQKLYQHQNFASMELHEFINDLYKQIASVMSNFDLSVIFKNEIANILVDIDTSVPLGLIINELLTNSFKYAFINNPQPFIQIKLQTVTKDVFQLIYIDNGQGLPANFKVEEASSLGMQLMHMLATQLSGQMVYLRKDDLSIFTITFKTTEARSKE